MRLQLIKDTITLLRFPFSLFLLPTFFFAWSESTNVNFTNLVLVFFILHLLVYPASNGYNSFMDRDTGSIGGLKNPPPPNRILFYTTVAMDVVGILLSLLVNWYFTIGIIVYIVFSRAYSYRGIRLKRFAIPGFLTVFLVQGAVTFYTIFKGISEQVNNEPPLACLCISSLLIGALYPLTQVYQHQQDKEDNVESISYKLGFRGTFFFSALLFVAANTLAWFHYAANNNIHAFWIFTLALLPAVAYFFYWAILVFRNTGAANFTNSLRMNIIAAACTNIAFILITIART